MEYVTLTTEQKLNILRSRLTAEEASYFSQDLDNRVIGDPVEGSPEAEQKASNLRALDAMAARIEFYKKEIAQLEQETA